MMKLKKSFGIFLIIIGAVLLIGSFPEITGFTILKVAGFNNQIGGVLGVLLIIVGMGMMMAGIRKEKISGLEYSVEEAIKQGVPEEQANIMLKALNKKISLGDWVELKKFRVRDTSDLIKYPMGTSLCRYWGPKEYLELQQSQLDKFYREGKIGKTHEVVVGSDVYKGRSEVGKPRRLTEESGISIPPKGSQVLHRHWEIAQMYKNIKKQNKK